MGRLTDIGQNSHGPMSMPNKIHDVANLNIQFKTKPNSPIETKYLTLVTDRTMPYADLLPPPHTP